MIWVHVRKAMQQSQRNKNGPLLLNLVVTIRSTQLEVPRQVANKDITLHTVFACN